MALNCISKLRIPLKLPAQRKTNTRLSHISVVYKITGCGCKESKGRDLEYSTLSLDYRTDQERREKRWGTKEEADGIGLRHISIIYRVVVYLDIWTQKQQNWKKSRDPNKL